jgi:GT2 family glycosyltransferase
MTAALLVPCHNGARFLPALAAGARAQTRPFNEWWLCDDGSSDDSAAVAEQLGFRVLRHSHNRGPSAARNALARATTCEWIHFHDVDDLLAPDYLKASFAAARAGADLVICDMPWVDADSGKLIFHWRYDEDALRAAPYPRLIEQTIGGINALYRRSVFESVGGFDEKRLYWEDLDLALRLFRAGVSFRALPQDLVTAVRHRTSYSSRDSVTVWMAKIDLMAEWLAQEKAAIGATVAREAESIAVRMIGLGEMDAARRAVALCVTAGGRPPTTHHRAFGVLRRALPPFAALRLQQWFRRRFAA